MPRVQVQLTDEQVEFLKRRAQESGEGVSAQVRKAVQAWVDKSERQAKIDRAIAAIGGFHSGMGDLAERHDDYLPDDW